MIDRSHPPARWVLLLALTAVVLYLCGKVLIPFLSIILWAGVLAVLFQPTYRKVLQRTPQSPNLAAGYMTGLVLVTIILPFIGVALAVGSELQSTLVEAPAQITRLIEHPPERLAVPVQHALDVAEKRFGWSEDDLYRQLQRLATRASSVVVRGTVNAVGSIIEFLVALAMVLFTLFFFFRDGAHIAALTIDWIPLDRARSQALLVRVQDLIIASVYGIIVLAIIQGILGGLMFWWLGLPSPLLWTVVMSLMATIPMLGTFVVWVPAALYLAAVGSWGKALVLTLWGSLVIGMADNLLRPKLVGERASMHELLIFFAVLGGLDAFGVLGVLMGPVLIALGTALLTAFRATDHPDLLQPEPGLLLSGGS